MRSSVLIGRAWGVARIGITTLPAEIFIPFKQAWLISLYAVRDAVFLRLDYCIQYTWSSDILLVMYTPLYHFISYGRGCVQGMILITDVRFQI